MPTFLNQHYPIIKVLSKEHCTYIYVNILKYNKLCIKIPNIDYIEKYQNPENNWGFANLVCRLSWFEFWVKTDYPISCSMQWKFMAMLEFYVRSGWWLSVYFELLWNVMWNLLDSIQNFSKIWIAKTLCWK